MGHQEAGPPLHELGGGPAWEVGAEVLSSGGASCHWQLLFCGAGHGSERC